MQRYKSFLEDIDTSISKIQKYTQNLDYDAFSKNDMMTDAVLRNLEIIGEAVKNLPEEFRNQYSSIEWKKIAGLRDILSHAYFGIDLKIIWEVVQDKLPVLQGIIKTALSQEP